MTANGQASWSSTEERVASLYRALGYTVVRDVLVRGSQVDLVAEQRNPALGLIRIAVEVKDHPNGSLPIREVRSTLQYALLAVDRGDFHQVHLVTTGKITNTGRAEAAGNKHARVLTVDELEAELFHPDAALSQWAEMYTTEPISRRFVELNASSLDHGRRDLGVVLPSTQLLDVAEAQPDAAVVVFADYGSGKSTMLERIKAVAIRRRAENRSRVAPILIRLRDVAPDFNIEKVALDAFRSELGHEVRIEFFWDLLRSGRLLILLDGFDEMTLRSSQSTRERLLAGLSPIMFAPSPAILTSRPSYFASLDEYQTLLTSMSAGRPRPSAGYPDHQRIDKHVSRLVNRYRDHRSSGPVAAHALTYRLEPMGSEQISQFLALASPELEGAGTTPHALRAFLDKVYDLSDLISRPIILDMAVDSTVAGLIKPDQQTLEDGPAGLYETYALVRLERDWVTVENRQQMLSHSVRMRFAEECATFMEDNDVLRIEPDQIAAVAGRARHARRDEDLEAVLTDLRTCSFLTIDPGGALEFIHRSYQEFFYARRIKGDLSNGINERLKTPLRWEYAYFLGSMGYTNIGIYQTFTELARGVVANSPIGDNAAQALLIARDVARGLTWSHRTVRELRRQRIDIEASTLVDVRLEGLELHHADLTDCSLDLQIEAKRLESLTLKNCAGRINASGQIATLNVVGCDLSMRSQAPSCTATFEATKLLLRSDGVQHRFLHTTGRAQLERGIIEVDHSDLALATTATSGILEGSITDSLIDLDLKGWDSLAATITRTAIVVQGIRPYSTASTVEQRPKKILDEAPPGSGTVLIVDPSVNADRWWARQQGLVTVGARIPDARTTMPGLFVFEETDPERGSRPGTMGFWTETGRTIVMEGRGRRFNAARFQLSETVGKATARAVANGSWFTKCLRPVLEELGCPDDAIDRLEVLLGRWSWSDAPDGSATWTYGSGG